MDEKATFVDPQTRIRTLETLLGQSRAREEALTTQAFKDRERITQLQAEIGQLQTRITESAAAVGEAERKLAIIRVELESRRTEVERLGAANTDLHRELESVATRPRPPWIARAPSAASGSRSRRPHRRHRREPTQVVDVSEERRPSGAGWQTS